MEIDPMVIAIFGHPPEGIDLSANQEIKNTTIVLSMLGISALFLAGRIAIRTQQSHLSLDDYTISLSWLFVAITAAIVFLAKPVQGNMFGHSR
ncbi:uncharacterized protein FFB14_08567 [Fusarium fujikuroi]|nr:uncharacterized protein FFB14_08567 [Fusarium fujikuroi]